MVDLANLPIEVLNEILSLLPSREDSSRLSPTFFGDLYNVSLCSRRLHNIIEARIYSRIELSSSRSVALITRTFLERPQLAFLVLEATIDAYDGQDRTLGSDKLMASFSTDSLHTAVRATGLPTYETQSWVVEFRDGRSDARAALMVSMFPNLMTLSVIISTHDRPLRYLKLLAHHASHIGPASRSISSPSTNQEKQSVPQNTFATLKEVRIDSTSSLDYDETLPIMNLPSLRTLYTYGLFTSRWNWEPPPDSSGLWHLQLDGCDMNSDELFCMLRSCRALRTFEYVWDQHCWCDENYSNDEEDDEDDACGSGLDLGPIVMEGLSSSKSSLTSLKVDGFGVVRNDIRSFGSLVEFRNLQQIWAPSIFVLNASEERYKHHLTDMLPAALESLHLNINGLPAKRHSSPNLWNWSSLRHT